MVVGKGGIREIVVLSGKGGTGKSSITASFSALAENAMIADCDVDAADLYLVLPPTIVEKHEFISGYEAMIDPSICTRCGLCQRHCNFEAIDQPDGTGYAVDPVRCEGCGVCVRLCPVQAIAFTERSCGQWMVSKTRNGPMVHAHLYAAAENSGKLVALVRKEARRVALAEGRSLVLVDGPPGIGCPVIASLAGADAVVLVTEPSLSGRHDMKRLISLAKQFSIPVFVCVNKFDVDEQQSKAIELDCDGLEGVDYAGSIPYDEQVVKAQIAELSPVEFCKGRTREAIEHIWELVWSRM